MKTALRSVLVRFPLLHSWTKRIIGTVLRQPGVSSGYVELAGDRVTDEASRLRDAWRAEQLPERQRKLVEAQLATFKSGGDVPVFEVAVKAVRRCLPAARSEPVSLLEIGCSSGYYSEVFAAAGLPIQYRGCDYSEPFVALARKLHPNAFFDVQDATGLRYADGSFDIVISGGCLLHIPEYEVAIAETARVTRQFAIFHRTPVVTGRPTQYFRKLAYGVETVEIHFNEAEFLRTLERYGLEVQEQHTLSELVHDTLSSISADRTYVCLKRPK